MKNRFYFIVLSILIIISFLNCNGRSYKKFEKEGIAMGTSLSIIFFCDDAKKSEILLNQCYDLADRLERKASCKRDDSIISMLNNKKDMVITDDFVYQLILDSLKYSVMTGGAFDPSLYNITKLWGIESGNTEVPDKRLISEELKKSGYKNVVLKDKRVILKNDIAFDLGGIAKGRIIGEIADLLSKNGIKDFIVNGGGDIEIGGLYNNKRPWKIAITDPFDNNEFIGFIDLSDCNVVTSGDYERYFIGKDNKRYHHIMNPKTGYPAFGEVHSVTVISDDPCKSDSLATALFVMDKNKGLDYANQHKDIGAIFVTGDKNNKQVFCTDNIKMTKNNDGKWKFTYSKIK